MPIQKVTQYINSSRNTDYSDQREKVDSRRAYENILNPVFGGAYTTELSITIQN